MIVTRTAIIGHLLDTNILPTTDMESIKNSTFQNYLRRLIYPYQLHADIKLTVPLKLANFKVKLDVTLILTLSVRKYLLNNTV